MALPEGIRFLELGWWLVHVVAVWLVFAWGYRRGRADERESRRRGANGANRKSGD